MRCVIVDCLGQSMGGRREVEEQLFSLYSEVVFWLERACVVYYRSRARASYPVKQPQTAYHHFFVDLFTSNTTPHTYTICTQDITSLYQLLIALTCPWYMVLLVLVLQVMLPVEAVRTYLRSFMNFLTTVLVPPVHTVHTFSSPVLSVVCFCVIQNQRKGSQKKDTFQSTISTYRES